MLEALVDKGLGWSTVDAKAASEAELTEALGKAHGCSYTPTSSSEITQYRLDRGWVKTVGVLEAATDYKDLAPSAGDTLVINGHRIQLSDIIELNMPGRRALAKRIVDDLKDTTTWLSRVA